MDNALVTFGAAKIIGAVTVISYVFVVSKNGVGTKPPAFVWTLAIIAFLTLGASIYFGGKRNNSFSNLDDYAKTLNAKLKTPVLMGDGSRLDTVEGSGNTLVFRFTLVTVAKEQVNRETLNPFLAGVKTKLCNPPEGNVIKAGHNVEYRFNDKNGELIDSVVATPADCVHHS